MGYLNSYTAVEGTTLVSSADHAGMHNAVGSAVLSMQTQTGTVGGTNILKNISTGKFAVSDNGGTFNNGVIGTMMVRGGTVGTATIGTCNIVGGTFTGGTITANTIGSATIIGGTIGTALIGTSTITGGTANKINMVGYISPSQSTTMAGTGGTTTLDLSLTNEWRVTFGTGNGTLAVSNPVNGQKFLVSLTQDAVGTRTIVWFNTIRWTDGNGTPTLTTTAAKRDTFGFVATSGTSFDGYTVGLNI